jgi:ubiquinol-cytochrome c reductase cytochrome b subunit
MEPFQKDCGTCHVIEGLTEGGTRDAPKLFAYGSPQWVRRMIQRPGASDLYGYLETKDQMPSFAIQLSENDVRTIVRYLHNDYPGAPGKPTTSATPAPAAKAAAPEPTKSRAKAKVEKDES